MQPHGVALQIPFCGKVPVAQPAREWPLAGVRSQVVAKRSRMVE